MDEIREKVTEHDYAIKNIADSIHELSETSKDSNSRLGEIAKSMGKQELILEKLTNLEGNTKESINRVHSRIDGLEKEVVSYKDKGEDGGCSALKLLKEQEHTKDVELQDNVKSNQHRIDKLDGTLTWITRLIIGALVTGLMSLLFYMERR